VRASPRIGARDRDLLRTSSIAAGNGGTPSPVLGNAAGIIPAVEWWMWLAGGLVLLVVELVTPSGFFVMFFGLGALTVGALSRFGIGGAPWVQWLVFTVTSVVYLLLFRGRLQDRVEHPAPRVDSLIGELAVPRERIPPGVVGRVELRGTLWNGRNDAPQAVEPGQRCRVTGVDNLVVFIQPE
jgi:membrane protein implicated in regulation of membrane protease activity